MNIAIIGTGRMATNLGAGWLSAGHTVAFGSRSSGDIELPGDSERVTSVGHKEALEQGEVVVLAIPYGSVEGFAQEHAERLRNKLVIDISNPFSAQPSDGRSGARVTSDAIGAGARVAAAFKANFAGTLLHPNHPETGLARDVLYASDAEEKAVMEQLIGDLGFSPVYCGTIDQAVVLDLMVPLIIALDNEVGEGKMQAFFKVIA